MGLLAADAGTVTWQDGPLDLATRQRFGYMPEERGLYPEDAGRRPGGLLRHAARHGARPGLARRRRPRRVDGRRRGAARLRPGAVAGQPAARAARSGTRPRPGAAGAGRAVLRAGPRRRRHDGRCPGRAACHRHRCAVLQPPAGAGRAAVRPRRDHPLRAGSWPTGRWTTFAAAAPVASSRCAWQGDRTWADAPGRGARTAPGRRHRRARARRPRPTTSGCWRRRGCGSRRAVRLAAAVAQPSCTGTP